MYWPDLWCYCLLLLTKCEGFGVWPNFVFLYLFLLTKCDDLVFWSDFVMILFVVAHKVWWFNVLTWFYMLLFVVAHKVWWFCVMCALWSPAGKGLTSWLSFLMSNCEFVTFPLVSWVRCGTWLYRFLFFASLLTLILWFHCFFVAHKVWWFSVP